MVILFPLYEYLLWNTAVLSSSGDFIPFLILLCLYLFHSFSVSFMLKHCLCYYIFLNSVIFTLSKAQNTFIGFITCFLLIVFLEMQYLTAEVETALKEVFWLSYFVLWYGFHFHVLNPTFFVILIFKALIRFFPTGVLFSAFIDLTS